MKTSTVLNIVIILILALALFGAYYFFFASEGAGALLTREGQEGSPEAAAGREFLNTLITLRSLRLDESVLSDPVFAGLKDFSVELRPKPRGRANPFLPIGIAGTGTTSPRAPGTP